MYSSKGEETLLDSSKILSQVKHLLAFTHPSSHRCNSIYILGYEKEILYKAWFKLNAGLSSAPTPANHSQSNFLIQLETKPNKMYSLRPLSVKNILDRSSKLVLYTLNNKLSVTQIFFKYILINTFYFVKLYLREKIKPNQVCMHIV